MKMSNLLRGALLTATVIALPANAAAPDPDTVTQAYVKPVSKDGKQIGCQLALDVQRKGGKDAISFSITTMRVTETGNARGVKLGYIASPGAAPQAPAEVFLVNDGGDNKSDINGAQASDTSGFQLTPFRDGVQTRAAYDAIPTGKIRLSVSLDNGQTRVWSADLTKQKSVLNDWKNCVESSVPLQG